MSEVEGRCRITRSKRRVMVSVNSLPLPGFHVELLHVCAVSMGMIWALSLSLWDETPDGVLSEKWAY